MPANNLTSHAAADSTNSPLAGVESLMRFQQQQWLGLLAWQESLLAMQQDMYDQWLSRCAGGARLDD